MKWYEFLNFFIMSMTLLGSFYLFLKHKKLSLNKKQNMITKTVFAALNGLVLVQLYDMLVAISWARSNMCNVILGVPNYLYALAYITRNIYFLIVVIGIIVWINRKTEKVL